MTIDRLGKPGVPPSGAQRPERSPKDVAATGGASVDRAREADLSADTVEISAEVIGSTEADIPHGTLSAERLRELNRRIADGHYDAPAVRDAIAGRLLNDLDTTAGG